MASASVTIKIYSTIDIIVPNGFTPNGDGHNDILRVNLFGIRDFEYFTVFNRWGQRIFYTSDPGKGGTGRSKARHWMQGPMSGWPQVLISTGGLLTKEGRCY